MGTTVDISQGGILIETSRPIETAQILLVSVDSNKQMLEIKGEVVHTRAVGPSKYLSGIKFIGSREEVMKIVKNFIIEHHSRSKQIR